MSAPLLFYLTRLTNSLTCWYRPDEIAMRINILATVSRKPLPQRCWADNQLNSFAGIFDSLLTFGLCASLPSF